MRGPRMLNQDRRETKGLPGSDVRVTIPDHHNFTRWLDLERIERVYQETRTRLTAVAWAAEFEIASIWMVVAIAPHINLRASLSQEFPNPCVNA